MASINDLETVLVPVCAAVDVELVDVELVGRTLQVTIEREAGIDLELVAAATRAISEVLDTHEDLVPGGRYELEVSSPGLERRLRRPEHFRRVLGAEISVRTIAGSDGDRRIEGTLQSVDDEGFLVEDSDGKQRRISFADLERARTVFDWQTALRTASADADRASSSATTTEAREA